LIKNKAMKTKYWLIIIGVIILAVSIDKCSTANKIDDMAINIANYNGVVDSFRTQQNALITSNNSLTLTTQKQMKEIAAKNDTVASMIKKFKQVQNITYVTNNFISSGDSANFDKPIPCDFKPFSFTISTKEFTLEQTISNKGSKIDKLFIPNEIKIVYGQKKTGLFKSEHSVAISNSNAMMTASDIKNYTFKPNKMWYERPVVTSLIGFGAGFLTNTAIRSIYSR